MAAFTTRATGDTILAADHNEVKNFFELGTTAGIINASHKGASIASAATLTLGTDGNLFHVTGSTGPITAISNPAPGSGTQIVLIFDSTPTLTHSANLYLMGATNYTAVANDVMVLEYDGASVWREVNRNGSVPAASLPLHASRHNAGGADVMAIDAAAGTGSLRTLGSTSTTAAAGNHTTPAATVSVAGHMVAADKQMLTRQAVTGGTVTIDWSAGTRYELTSNANIAITMTNGIAGESHIVVLKYGGTHTVTWTTTVIWDNGTTPTWQSSNTKVDLVVLYWDGTTWRGGLGGKFAS